jgi:hypothetical protein
MRWGMLAAVAAAGALLLAVFIAPTGSGVAVAGALLTAGALTAVAAAILLRSRAAARGVSGRRLPRRTTQPRRGPLPPRPEARRAEPPPPPGGGPPAPAVDHAGPGVRAAEARGAPSTGVAAVARELALLAVQRTGAPAASVLVPRGRRLLAAGTAGDWALARQLQAETREDIPGWPARSGGPDSLDEAEPPSFPVDDTYPEVLALYTRAAPVERWQTLEDAPLEVLPLAGLADRGAGVVVPLANARRLLGLWVLARRPKGRAYTDAELQTLERLARQAAPALGAALDDEPA